MITNQGKRLILDGTIGRAVASGARFRLTIWGGRPERPERLGMRLIRYRFHPDLPMLVAEEVAFRLGKEAHIRSVTIHLRRAQFAVSAIDRKLNKRDVLILSPAVTL